MKRNIVIWMCWMFALQAAMVVGQEFTPLLKQFSKQEYGAANQNWAVGQSAEGMMYFGNNMGLLAFDGAVWQLHLLPEGEIVRSLLVKGNRIYVGSYEEFGYFEKDRFGNLSYVSLADSLKNYSMSNDEVWKIVDTGTEIVFQSFTSFFVYKDGLVKGFRSKHTFLFFNYYKQQMYSHTNEAGLSVVDVVTGKVRPITNAKLRSEVIAILNFDKERGLVVTKNGDLFLMKGDEISVFETDATPVLKRSEVNRALVTRSGVIVIGTIQNGVTAIDRNGNYLWTLNTTNNLQNNTVLGLYCDKEDNVWVALDKGIAYIQMNSKMTYLNSFKPSIGAIYSVAKSGTSLLLGTNQGLYRASYDSSRKLISGVDTKPLIQGHVWDVSRFDKDVICGNNDVTYTVDEHRATALSPVRGGICIRRGVIHNEEVLIQGTYTNLCVYRKVNGKWVFSNTVEGFVNPVRYIEIDYTGKIWAAHLHRGMYAIQLSTDFSKVMSVEYFKSLDTKEERNVNVFSVNNRVVFTDHTRFYTYDDIKKTIIPYAELNRTLGYFARSYRVTYFKDDMYWFILPSEAALVQITPTTTRIVDVVNYAAFRNQTVDDYQNVLTLSDNECLFTLENGLAIYNYSEKWKAKVESKLMFSKLLFSDSEGNATHYVDLSSREASDISFRQNNLTVSVFFSDYSYMNTAKYRYKLVGDDKVWNELSASSVKAYSYLPQGDYTLHAEAIAQTGEVLAEANFSFRIEPPIYLSAWAKLIYVLLSALLVWAVFVYVRYLYRQKKIKIHNELEAIRMKEIEKRENQIFALENEKLETQLKMKSKELAESTMTIIKKNEILAGIKDEITNQKSILGSQYPNKYYDKLIKMLDENLSSEADWAIFQTNFDRIHENFFRNLRSTYPELTANDLRLCAYLRLNLSSKDIANLMNISLKGVEVGRYRLRKKMNVPSHINLTEFMIDFK